MNKGQSGIPQWVVLMILGVILTTMTGAVYYSVFIESQKSKTSFDNLIEKINEMNDGETLDYSLYLDSSDILISFDNGLDYQGPSNLDYEVWPYDCEQDEKIKVSPSCGSYDCLCICDTSLQYELEESCTEHSLVCYPFTDKKFTFYDPTCPSAVYKEGENNGVLELHLQLKDNILSFCENKACIADKDEEVVKDFSSYINSYKSCLASKSTCSCDLDYTFLTKGYYALNFYSDRIELFDIISKKPIVSELLTTNIGLSVPNKQFTNVISLYQFEEQDYTIPEYANINGIKSFVVSTSISDISIIGSMTDKQILIDTTLLFKENKLYFTQEDLTQYTSCSIDERVVL